MRNIATFIVVLAAWAPLGCSSTAGSEPNSCTSAKCDGVDPSPRFDPPRNCDSAISVEQYWDHNIASPLVTALGSPYHGSSDAITNPGMPVDVSARFVYGPTAKDLEDETILAYVEHGDCRWQPIGSELTDDDGVVRFSLSREAFPSTGAYNIEFVVRGDDSRVRSTIWVVAPGTDAVIFDIDGTLTTSDSEIFKEVLLGKIPQMYSSANQVTRRYQGANYFPIYITGRPVYLDLMTSQWLVDHGMPAGPLQLTTGILEAAFEVERYKRDTLVSLSEKVGIDLEAAYGNATTDICAYATAGIDPNATYIIGKHGGKACQGFTATTAVVDYPSHLDSLEIPTADHQN